MNTRFVLSLESLDGRILPDATIPPPVTPPVGTQPPAPGAGPLLATYNDQLKQLNALIQVIKADLASYQADLNTYNQLVAEGAAPGLLNAAKAVVNTDLQNLASDVADYSSIYNDATSNYYALQGVGANPVGPPLPISQVVNLPQSVVDYLNANLV